MYLFFSEKIRHDFAMQVIHMNCQALFSLKLNRTNLVCCKLPEHLRFRYAVALLRCLCNTRGLPWRIAHCKSAHREQGLCYPFTIAIIEYINREKGPDNIRLREITGYSGLSLIAHIPKTHCCMARLR